MKCLDPGKGPLDDMELQEFNEKAAQMYEQKHITTSTLAFRPPTEPYGPPPGQLALICIDDLSSGETPDGNGIHLVRIPRAKQGKPPREETKAFAITAELYRLPASPG